MGDNPRCLCVWCTERQDGRRSRWWRDYGCCSREHTIDYYGPEVIG